jgi:hypothetical protein
MPAMVMRWNCEGMAFICGLFSAAIEFLRKMTHAVGMHTATECCNATESYGLHRSLLRRSTKGKIFHMSQNLQFVFTNYVYESNCLTQVHFCTSRSIFRLYFPCILIIRFLKSFEGFLLSSFVVKRAQL